MNMKNKHSFFSSKDKRATTIGTFSFLAIASLLAINTGCSGSDKEVKEATALDTFDDATLRTKSAGLFGSISSLPAQEINADMADLGMKLYYDTRLSKDGNISCNSCHNLNTYGVDNLSFSPGDTKELGGRNSPTVLHAAIHAIQFWDGRAKDVEEQAGGPILNPVEHNIPSQAFLEKRLREVEDYRNLFKKAFPNDAQPITFANVQKAIGAFERQLLPESRYDKWQDGDNKALTTEEKEGLQTFIDKGCIACHTGPAFGGKMLQKFGLFSDYWEHTKSKKVDNGLYDITKNEGDKYIFKVPGLRNIEKTYPYFHDGSVEKLEDAVRIMGKTQIANELDEEEVKSIVTFLKSLTADVDAKYKK